MILKSGKSLEEFLLEGMNPEETLNFVEKQIKDIVNFNPDIIWNQVIGQYNRRYKTVKNG